MRWRGVTFGPSPCRGRWWRRRRVLLWASAVVVAAAAAVVVASAAVAVARAPSLPYLKAPPLRTGRCWPACDARRADAQRAA
eukprot:1666006-Prymnesium_polylepis.1